ncbi:alpha/beta family hydrolase [Jeotgalibacillus proteolyticus]|uniref:Alpha/beta hydrolase n=1 Tax=Jeotgalibacillus proteolyticus TaxID=2082395 RepID=A0A2S5GFB8_9BACL|nr:alpha/beta hydrolase [Jeotgalibacillus proteolyticus]PPA71679.1 alpha/beta hydrolase [Jeotgalibacillus proteolyticus]
MVQFQRLSINGYNDLTVPYTKITSDKPSAKLAIILPGLGYTAQAPLLFYATSVYSKRGFDVLQINYQYNTSDYDSFTQEELSTAIQSDVRTVIDRTLTATAYSEICLIGKSLGTIAIASELKRDFTQSVKAVWLTPLLQREDVTDAILQSKIPGLCIIGDKDPCFIKERFQMLLSVANLTFMLIPNADHSLDLAGDITGSIEILKKVVNELEKF